MASATANFIVEPLRVEQLDEVVHFACQYFLTSEPLVAALEWDFEVDVRPWFSHHVRTLLLHNLAVCIRDASVGERPLVAVCIAAVQSQSGQKDSTILNFVDALQTPRVRQLTNFLNRLIEDIDFYALYQVSELVYIDILCVHPEYYGRDLSKQLILLTEEEAHKRGIRLVMTETTGHYAARVFSYLDYTLHTEMQYEDYRDHEGKVVFRNTGIHRQARAFAKLLLSPRSSSSSPSSSSIMP